jgi:flagellar biosynthesis chaperone FliJ
MSRQVAELNSTMQTQREAAQQLQQQLDTAQANWQQAQQAANQLEAQLHHCTSAAAAQQQHMVSSLVGSLLPRGTP